MSADISDALVTTVQHCVSEDVQKPVAYAGLVAAIKICMKVVNDQMSKTEKLILTPGVGVVTVQMRFRKLQLLSKVLDITKLT